MAKKLSRKSQEISQDNNIKYGIKPSTETVFIKNDDPKEAREALKQAGMKKREQERQEQEKPS